MISSSLGQQSDQLVELASGIDSLYLSGHGVLSPGLLADLKRLRSEAEEQATPVSIDLGASKAWVQPRSFGRYKFRLQCEHGLIGISDSTALPPIRVQPTARYLHAVGPEEAVRWFDDLARGFTRYLQFSASRVDVYADWQGWSLTVADRCAFVGRATRRDMHEESESLTGYEFGRRKTGTVSGRIYDKSLDVRLKGSDWWHEVWGERYQLGAQILRVEFEFGRKGLCQYGVNSANDAVTRAPGLWKAATHDWLSHRVSTQDLTRSRWPVSPEWRQIQAASFAEHAIGLDRAQEGSKAGSLRKLLPGLVGYMANFAVQVGTSDIDDTIAALPQYLRDYATISRTTFADRIIAKRRALATS
jgi:hypothetical protein